MKKPKLVYSGHRDIDGKIHAGLYPKNRAEIIWTAWCQGGKVLHIVEYYCGSVTACGTRMYTKHGWWKTAWGIPENMKERMCYRCMYRYAGVTLRQEGKYQAPWKLRTNYIPQEPDVI